MTFENPKKLETTLAIQKAASNRDGIPTAERRIEWLDKSIDLLCTHRDALCEAMCADFGHRSKDESTFADISSSIDALKYAKKHLRAWMRPAKRSAQFPLGVLGARAAVHYQPKGVVGIISPWNFPVNLTFTPLAGVLAAGNRAMIKPSEFTENTSELMAKLIAEYYAEEEIAVVTGGAEAGAAFSALPFDHLVFTGATSIAYHVMRAAADNLVPVTLELGGKSPVIIGASADLQKAAVRIMSGKALNAGQICLAPDYVLLPEGKTADFVEAAKSAVATMFPSGLKENDDCTSVINERHFDRLSSYIEDARSRGADIIEINPNGEDFSQQSHHKMPPCIIVGATDDMLVMQDEIFGPILPIKNYANVKDAVTYINTHPRPLGLYYFGNDKDERDYVLNNTTSGGVTVNDVIFHVTQEDLPFGGVGPSGMGAYHGKDGFMEFSHKKAVYTQVSADLLSIARPPYGEKFRKFIGNRLKP
ncbi:MAG: coniferyl aldehyde dehydrogenase [Gammaproteobacteria bacterium]|nr:coniferyl aldehyde dehydrogenase [Gammaproteobacteria bacterium]MDH3372648.1 coniferyl aldehyde dehydrogenase [Gammaproteobacteria bacterium]